MDLETGWGGQGMGWNQREGGGEGWTWVEPWCGRIRVGWSQGGVEPSSDHAKRQTLHWTNDQTQHWGRPSCGPNGVFLCDPGGG